MKIKATIELVLECSGTDAKDAVNMLHDFRELVETFRLPARVVTTRWDGEYEEVTDDNNA